tara:strand:- start:7772 stop:8254 length:483 start_codon:yes stop_codon:yes gene_type:complete
MGKIIYFIYKTGLIMNSESIWFNKDVTIEDINKRGQGTIVSYIDIVITECGDNFLKGTMPVNEKTIQPAHILHGGSSCVLAESLGSIAGNMVIDTSKQMAVGQSITASHIRPGIEGTTVTGKAYPIHLGKRSQIWEIEITNDQNKLVCKSSLTMAIVDKK